MAASFTKDPVHHYWLAKTLYELNLPANREAYVADPQQYLSVHGSQLSPAERQMLLEQDIAGLHRTGVSIYLIRTLALIAGISIVETGVRTGGRQPQRN